MDTVSLRDSADHVCSFALLLAVHTISRSPYEDSPGSILRAPGVFPSSAHRQPAVLPPVLRRTDRRERLHPAGTERLLRAYGTSGRSAYRAEYERWRFPRSLG